MDAGNFDFSDDEHGGDPVVAPEGQGLESIYLDPKARNDTEYKLETFSGVYRKLSGKDVIFEYPITEA
ncbi:hypothetical protein Vadar_020505 [Vaccinium darrowii]|uniref:Uncharacterized protein n=1 Tax=Vaccinium darrowii TaxID=229202 RepID=A0ACB7XIT9_9ERIC|nr:hypothetical protein Vadar_020505 [Vaccinium darrowii]